MRILHLAYEDPRQPGSGGGSVRTMEVNRRLARSHEITALVASYPGALERVEEGVHWIPVGPRWGVKPGRLAYFALLGREIVRHRHDLLVEDFGAPFSVGFSPLFTRRPVVAMVQWLFAGEKAAQYHLPFDAVEAAGLRLYDDFIAVSDWLAAKLRSRRTSAHVEVIPEGVDDEAFVVQHAPPRHLVFVGRLEQQQKGTDMLLEVMTRARRLLGSRTPPLHVVGDGPDRARMEADAERRDLAALVHFRGRMTGVDKYQMMADAYAVLMPSRYETFGMVAAESLAAGAPLVTFDVGPLRDVTGGEARLVRPFDLDAFAREVANLVDNPADTGAREQTRRWARRYRWDEVATRQEQHYLRAAAGGRAVL